jgi:DNA-binding NarL/FixJ family response regulator
MNTVALTQLPAGAGDPQRSHPRRFHELTERELEILALIADGLSNEGIAHALIMSRRTVDAHLRAIFLKLGLPNHPLHSQRVRAVMAYWAHSNHRPIHREQRIPA